MTVAKQQPIAQASPQLRQDAGLRIDTGIRRRSHYRPVNYAMIVMLLLLVAVATGFTLWQYLLLLISIVVSMAGVWLTQMPLVHLTQPQLSAVHGEWLLTVDTSRGEQLWQAKLTSVEDYEVAMVFCFAVTQPYQRRMHCCVYRDQVTMTAWWQMKIMAQL